MTAKLISAFVFATRIVQSLYYLNPKFQASSHLLWLYRPDCVRPGRKPQRPVFSERGSYKTRHMLGFLFQTGGWVLLHESSAESTCKSFLHYFHSAKSNHLSIAISMSPEWMVTLNRFNALVICNHASPPHPHPRGRAGDSCGNERCFYFCIVPAVRGKYQGLVLYRQKRQCNENIRLWGKTAVVLPADCLRSVGVIAGD